MRRKPVHYLKVLQWVIVVAIFFFLGKMAWDNWNQVKDATFAFRAFPLISSTLIFAFSYFIQIWAWYLITLKLGVAVSAADTLKGWFYSQLGKYLPGKVWLFLSRLYFYESKGKSKKAVSIALYFEMGTMIGAACLISLTVLIFHKEKWLFYSWRQLGWLLPLLVLGFASLHPRVLQKIVNWVLIRFKREPFSLSLSYQDILWILFVCIISWMVGGVGFYFFVDSIFPVAPQDILFLAGALALSSTLGLIAIFAPSGLGVREGVLVYLLSFLMVTPVAVIISVLTRLWMTFIEIGLIGVVYLLGQLQLREEGKRLGKA